MLRLKRIFLRLLLLCQGPGYVSRHSDSLRAGRSGDQIPVGRGGETFRTRPDRPWAPPILLYNGYRVFPGDKATGGVVLTAHPHLAPKLKEE